MVEYSDKLLEEITPMLKNLAIKIDDSHVEDLIQVGKEAFLKCLKTYDKSKKTKFSTYVYNKARRAMQDEVRRTGWFKRLGNGYKMTLFSDFDDNIELSENMEDIILNREKSGNLRESIEQLPKEQAKVLILIYWNGMTRLECAVSMGLTESRISQIYSEALKNLKEHLSKGD
jgi:RNA polymerase sigma factor (sigma-70 family)